MGCFEGRETNIADDVAVLLLPLKGKVNVEVAGAVEGGGIVEVVEGCGVEEEHFDCMI